MIAALLALSLSLAQQEGGAEGLEARSSLDAMNRARATFEYGDYPQASKLFSQLIEAVEKRPHVLVLR